MLTGKILDRLTTNTLGSVMKPQGFRFSKGVFLRELPSLILHLLIVDFDTRLRKTFRVLVGLNSTLFTQGSSILNTGAYYSKYLGKNGITNDQQKWPCYNEDAATTSLAAVTQLVEAHAFAWFDQFPTIESFADVLGSEFDLLKGRMYLHTGLKNKARAEFEAYLTRLDAMDSSEEVSRMIQEIRSLLEVCSM